MPVAFFVGTPQENRGCAVEFLDSLEPWQRLAIVLGVIATALSIVARVWKWALVRWFVGIGQRFLLWGFRRALINILTSDRSEARAHLVYLLEPEINRLEGVEKQLTTLQRTVHTLSGIVHSDRDAVRGDIAAARADFAKLEETIETTVLDIRQTLHTLLGAVLGKTHGRGQR